ncbi:MAG: acetolactate synthase large subunit [Planctomycetes bacterium]|nr:acetolactate synthase large subunit [Planctomycetota bacterium]
MKASDLFVQALEREGVEYIFGIPGEENLDVLESLRESSIRLILTRHEQAAGFMATTYGRLTGKAGVCLSTLGPGATNLVTAAAYANLGAMPMVMITGQKPIRSNRQALFQLVEITDMMRPLTKYTKQIEGADLIPSCVREAFRRAQEERPGAAHLELPEDIAREETEMPVIDASYVRRPIAEQKCVKRAVELIRRAKHPLLVIGASANRNLTSKMLRQLVHQTGIPFVTTQMGKGVINEDEETFMGNAALSSGDFVHQAIDSADVLINVGHDVVEKPPFVQIPGGRTVIHVNFTSAEASAVYFPQVEVIGDIANSIWQFTEQIEKQDSWDFSHFRNVREQLEANIIEKIHDDRFPILPQRLVADVREAVPDDGIIALDNGVYKIWFARNYKARQPNTVLLDNALSTMGAGVPSAMASCLVHPGRKILAICGDGGYMMNSQELETAVRLKLDLSILILNDSAYGMIKWKQQNMGFPDFGLDFHNPDFVKHAESFGAKGHRVKSAGELVPLLRSCFNLPGVHVIDVPMDYSENSRLLHQVEV